MLYCKLHVTVCTNVVYVHTPREELVDKYNQHQNGHVYYTCTRFLVDEHCDIVARKSYLRKVGF